MTRAVCDGKSYEYIYDAYGNLKEKRSNGKRLVSYTHDRAGQITEIRDPAGVCTRYEYDILGRRSRIFNDDGLEVRYGYDALNRIRHIRYGNGVETAYTYDGDGNVRTLETRAGENVLLSFAYRYDGNGNRTAKTGTQATLGGITSEITTGNNALDISYNYDVRGQLLEERRNGASVSYAYDKAGNRIRKTDAQGEIRYLYNAKNQLVEEESPADRKQFSYDRQGGIIEEKNAAGIRRFSYNSRHQQTRVETETGSVQENRYDAEGLRFELLENGRRTSFVYHNGELLEEGREEQGISYHLGAGMEAFRRGQELSYYHRDEQLSTVFVTDGQGEIRNSYQYDAFGIPLETTEQLNNRIRYTGQQYDELTEQYYLRARYYNPVAGRFMQEDVYQGDGLNLYAYCGNNPVVYDDPSGYASTSTGKACPPQGKISESVDETSYGKSSGKYDTTADFLTNIESGSDSVKNWKGQEVKVPDGHIMSPRDPSFSAKPITEAGPYTLAQRDAFLAGNSAGTKLAPHHRHQIPVRDGGVIDELPGPGHPSGNQHTAGSPSRHPAKSIFNSERSGNVLRANEITQHWIDKGNRLIEVEPGVWIDPGF